WVSVTVTVSSTALPTGTQLVEDTVTVTDGVARVELSAEPLAADPAQQALMVAQIEESLRSVPSVQSVEVVVGGAPLVIDEVHDLLRNPYVTGSPVVIAEGVPQRFTGSGLVPLSGAGIAAEPRMPALPYEDLPGRPVALDGTDRLVTLPTEQDVGSLLLTGEQLVAPSVDRHGWIWTTPRASDGTV